MEQNACVAVLRDGAGRVSDARSATVAQLYSHTDGVWRATGETPVPHSGDGMNSVRDDMRALIAALGDCRVLAAKGLGGVAYGVFDRMGFHIFDVEEADAAALNGMLQDIEDADGAARIRRETLKHARPAETDNPGVYWLDLILLQAECPEVSSKKALRGFLSDTPFRELHLICKHAPPWLEGAGLELQTETRPDGSLHLTITRRMCRA